MDPIGLGISTTLAVTKGVAAWLKGKASAEELQQLTVRYWGAVLFEMRSNLDALETAVLDRRAGRPFVPLLRFTYSDVLLPELARMCPLPNVLSLVAGIIQEQKFIQSYIDLAAVADARRREPGYSIQSLNPTKTWLAAASEFLPRQVRSFNQLQDAMNDQGRQAFGDQWQVIGSVILPDPISASPSAR
jgi:hypothetical protein